MLDIALIRFAKPETDKDRMFLNFTFANKGIDAFNVKKPNLSHTKISFQTYPTLVQISGTTKKFIFLCEHHFTQVVQLLERGLEHQFMT